MCIRYRHRVGNRLILAVMTHFPVYESIILRRLITLNQTRFAQHNLKNFSTASLSPYGNVTNKPREPPVLHKSLPEPYGGGDIYWAIRRKCSSAGLSAIRLMTIRFINTDFIRMIYAGIPKKSYDPKINQFYIYMDNEEWTGAGGRFWIDFSNGFLFPLYIAFWLYFFTYRIFYNNKHNVFARWANRDDE